MMGTKARAFAPLCNRSIEDLVPAGNFYRHLEAKLDLGFVRPSVQAALELGVEELQAGLDAGLAANVGELVESLRQVAPGLLQRELERLARAIRRVDLGALVDRHADLAETRAQLRLLIEAHTADALEALVPPEQRAAYDCESWATDIDEGQVRVVS
jgi:hypothetical protein